MFVKFLRENKAASYLITVLRVVLGYTWFIRAYEKIAHGFDATTLLNKALGKTEGVHPDVQGFWASFIREFALPHVQLFNTIVPWGELLVGLALMIGCFTTIAAFIGVIMNVSYLMSGSVSTNPYFLLCEFLVLVAGVNAAKYGVDRWVLPYLKAKLSKQAVPLEVEAIS